MNTRIGAAIAFYTAQLQAAGIDVVEGTPLIDLQKAYYLAAHDALVDPDTGLASKLPKAGDNYVIVTPGAGALAAGITAASALTPAANKRVVVQVYGRHTDIADQVVPEYVDLVGMPGAELVSDGEHSVLKPESHSSVRRFRFRGTGDYSTIVCKDDGVSAMSDIEIADNDFAGMSVSQIDFSGSGGIDVSDIRILRNRFAYMQPLTCAAANSLAYLQIIDNIWQDTMNTAAAGCCGFMDATATIGESYGHVVRGNVGRVHVTQTGGTPGGAYCLSLDMGFGSVVRDNDIDITYVNNIAGQTDPTGTNLIAVYFNPTLPASGETQARSNVIANNSFRIRYDGTSTAAALTVTAIHAESQSNAAAMPDLILGPNVFEMIYKDSFTKKRLALSQTYSGSNGAAYLAPGAMGGFDDGADDLTNAEITELQDAAVTELQADVGALETDAATHGGYVKIYDATVSVSVSADDTYAGTAGKAMTVPGPCVLRGLLVCAAAPGGTAGGDKSINLCVGTAQNADADLDDANENDVLIATDAQTGAFVWGKDPTMNEYDVSGAFWPVMLSATDPIPWKYLAADQTLYLNVLAKSSGATGTPGTVTVAVKVYALLDPLPE